MAQDLVFSIVMAIIVDKQRSGQHPAYALLGEVAARSEWSSVDVRDILDQLVINERLSTDSTINDRYYRLADQ